MSAEADSGEKIHDPTPRRLEQAREKGEIARSPDLVAAVAYSAILGTAMILGGQILTQMLELGGGIFQDADRLGDLLLGGQGRVVGGSIMGAAALALMPWFAIPAISAALALLVLRGFTVTPSKLHPKPSRISIISNAKNKFGHAGLFEFAKALSKLIILSVILGIFLYGRSTEILQTLWLSPRQVVLSLGEMLISFMIIVVIASLLIGGVDYLWQLQEHLRRNMMSRQELMDESKQSEGDPHMKQKRRQRGYEIAMNQMLQDVAEANVVIVNPAHYAVALKWDRSARSAPVCVAKGVDEIAARIRERAMEAAVPIHRDPPTARAIFATVEIGQEVAPDQYRAVAAAIRFADAMRTRARAKG